MLIAKTWPASHLQIHTKLDVSYLLSGSRELPLAFIANGYLPTTRAPRAREQLRPPRWSSHTFADVVVARAARRPWHRAQRMMVTVTLGITPADATDHADKNEIADAFRLIVILLIDAAAFLVIVADGFIAGFLLACALLQMSQPAVMTRMPSSGCDYDNG